MKLDSFREVLLKKCEDDSLKNLVKYVREDVLTDLVIESLEKMADSSNSRKGLNPSILHFADRVKNDEHGVFADMYHDALSHHASHYKAAIGQGNQDAANAHARKIFDLMHLGKKIEEPSGYNISVSGPHPKAWVSHAFGVHDEDSIAAANERAAARGKGPIGAKVGDFKTEPKNWDHQGKDFSFLQMAPNTHKSNHRELDNKKYTGAFPMEGIMVNGKHLHIDDDISQQDANRYTPHEFDSHPFIRVGKKMGSATADDHRDYLKGEADWMSNQYNSWADRHMEMHESDPEGYMARGSKKPDAIHPEVENPLDLDALFSGEGESTPSTPASKPSKPKIESDEDFAAHLENSLGDVPDHIKASMLEALKGGK